MKIGDTVMLLSGGPVMTIMAVTGGGYICGWFSAASYMQAEFSAAVLKPAKPRE